MRKRFVRALIFAAVAVGLAVGASSAAGALDFGGPSTSVDSTSWD